MFPKRYGPHPWLYLALNILLYLSVTFLVLLGFGLIATLPTIFQSNEGLLYVLIMALCVLIIISNHYIRKNAGKNLENLNDANLDVKVLTYTLAIPMVIVSIVIIIVVLILWSYVKSGQFEKDLRNDGTWG